MAALSRTESATSAAVQQRLGRDAAVVQAGSAELALLDESDGQVELSRPERCGVTATATAQDEDVKRPSTLSCPQDSASLSPPDWVLVRPATALPSCHSGCPWCHRGLNLGHTCAHGSVPASKGRSRMTMSRCRRMGRRPTKASRPTWSLGRRCMPTTVVLVAGDGEFIRRRGVRTAEPRRNLRTSVGIPIYDTQSGRACRSGCADYALRQHDCPGPVVGVARVRSSSAMGAHRRWPTQPHNPCRSGPGRTTNCGRCCVGASQRASGPQRRRSRRLGCGRGRGPGPEVCVSALRSSGQLDQRANGEAGAAGWACSRRGRLR